MTGKEHLEAQGINPEEAEGTGCPSDYGLENSLDVCNENGDGCESCWETARDSEVAEAKEV